MNLLEVWVCTGFDVYCHFYCKINWTS